EWTEAPRCRWAGAGEEAQLEEGAEEAGGQEAREDEARKVDQGRHRCLPPAPPLSTPYTGHEPAPEPQAPSKERIVARPVPVCKCFVLCRQVFVDPMRQDYTVVSPVHQVFPAQYPGEEQLAVFARWANAHGSYEVEVQLRSLESEVLCSCKMEKPFRADD